MNIETFIKEVEKLNITVTKENLASLAKYKDLLIEYNKKFNLTAIKSDEEIYLKVNTVKKLELYVESNTYGVEEPIEIETNGYTISNDEYELSSSIVNYDDTTKKLTYNAKVKNLLNNGSNVKVELKLYDENNTVLVTKEVDNSGSSDKNNFDVLFDIALDSEVNYENIKYLSVNFINE